MKCLCYDFQFYVVMAHAKIDCDCVEVEFNNPVLDRCCGFKCSKENCSKLTS